MCARSVAVKVAPGISGNEGSTSHRPAPVSGSPAVLGVLASAIVAVSTLSMVPLPPPSITAFTVALPAPSDENHASLPRRPLHVLPPASVAG